VIEKLARDGLLTSKTMAESTQFTGKGKKSKKKGPETAIPGEASGGELVQALAATSLTHSGQDGATLAPPESDVRNDGADVPASQELLAKAVDLQKWNLGKPVVQKSGKRYGPYIRSSPFDPKFAQMERQFTLFGISLAPQNDTRSTSSIR
jgi:hypothetical protein